MKGWIRWIWLLGFLGWAVTGCMRVFDPAYLDELIYQQLLEEGWMHFQNQEYDSALYKFSRARVKNPTAAAPYTGLAWTYMMMDELETADFNFENATLQFEVDVHAYAGWAFLKNALQQFEASNIRVDQALSLDSSWTFPYGLPLNVVDLWILKAENYFLLGDFSSSLQMVQKLNPDFSVDVSTPEGQMALAQEIERLQSERGGPGKRIFPLARDPFRLQFTDGFSKGWK
ncbi:MAG: hypothetical protein GXO78_07695 [Calditrichaeota bacterium]|nr:hypothetical protein [Calditrichota bacterium]